MTPGLLRIYLPLTGTVVLEGLGLDGSKISVIVEEVKPVLGFTSLFERPEGL